MNMLLLSSGTPGLSAVPVKKASAAELENIAAIKSLSTLATAARARANSLYLMFYFAII
jgi:hypothetical protein